MAMPPSAAAGTPSPPSNSTSEGPPTEPTPPSAAAGTPSTPSNSTSEGPPTEPTPPSAAAGTPSPPSNSTSEGPPTEPTPTNSTTNPPSQLPGSPPPAASDDSPPPPSLQSPAAAASSPPPPPPLQPPPQAASSPPPPSLQSPPAAARSPPPPPPNPQPSPNLPPPTIASSPPPPASTPPPPPPSPSFSYSESPPSPPSSESPPSPPYSEPPPSSPPPQYAETPPPPQYAETPPPPPSPQYSEPPPSPAYSEPQPPPPSYYYESPPSGPFSPPPPPPPPNTTTPTVPSSSLSPPAAPSSNGGGGQGKKFSTSAAIGVGMAAVILLVLFLVIAVLLRRKKKKSFNSYNSDYIVPTSNGSSQISGSPYSRGSLSPLMKVTTGNLRISQLPLDPPSKANNQSWFTYEELKEITNGFSLENRLGQGGFGCVFKGQLSDGREVAVKQLNIGGSQGEREFQAEVEIISRVHHRHLVSLVGYCVEENHRLLVYDYVPNKTLYHHLHGRGRQVLDWPTRVKIAAGAARGLAYLHEDCHPRIIHRDIKSSNILLDNKFEALVADFGLAKLSVDTNTHVSTRVMGTFGYLAPEYAATGKLTEKSDVFSFGVVLLELITGRKPIDASIGDESLADWARPLMTQALENGQFEDLADPTLENNYNASEMFRMIEAAAACVRYNSSIRPKLGRVMRALDNLADGLDLHNGVTPGQTQVYGQPNTEEVNLFHKTAFGSQDYSSDFSRGSWSQKQL